eukprot:356275-Chlamydomonas_euryale.AAC.6
MHYACVWVCLTHTTCARAKHKLSFRASSSMCSAPHPPPHTLRPKLGLMDGDAEGCFSPCRSPPPSSASVLQACCGVGRRAAVRKHLLCEPWSGKLLPGQDLLPAVKTFSCGQDRALLPTPVPSPTL